MEPSVGSRELHRVFGENALEPGLFYANEPALRFELSRGGTRVEQFTLAYDRARYALRGTPTLTVVLAWWGEGPPVRHLDVFRSLLVPGLRR